MMDNRTFTDDEYKTALLNIGFVENDFFGMATYELQKTEKTPCPIKCFKSGDKWILQDEGSWVDKITLDTYKEKKRFLSDNYFWRNAQIIIHNGYVEKILHGPYNLQLELRLFIDAIVEAGLQYK